MLLTVAHTGTATLEVTRPQVADPAKGPSGEDVDRRDPEGVEAEAIQNTQRYMTRSLIQRPKVMTNDFRKIPVGGRLSLFAHKWSQKGSANWRTIKKGVGWKWSLFPNHKGSTHQRTSTKLDVAIKKMRKQRVIQRIKFLKFTSNLFSVPKKDSTESRTILDLSDLNEFIQNRSFKMLTMKEIKLLLPKGYWTVSLDLKDGFYHLSISKGLRKYLGFKYKGICWAFRAMPFGLNIAPRIFTNIIADVVRMLEQENIWCLPYLDDLLLIARTKEECERILKRTLSTLTELGWIINMKKSRMIPQQKFVWLGVEYDLVDYTLNNSEQNLGRFHTQLQDLLMDGTCTKRRIMGVQGLANWLGQVSPQLRLLQSRTRRFLKKHKKDHLDMILELKNKWKLAMIKWLYTRSPKQRLGIPISNIIIVSDASKTGWGFTINGNPYRGEFYTSMTSTR